MNSSLLATLGSLLVLSACSGGGRAADPIPETPSDLLLSVETRDQGRELFLRHCALCHGERGDGHGVRRSLSKPPADLTDPLWRRRATPQGVYRAIRDGIPRSPMAGWKIFSEQQTWALTAHVLYLAEGEL